MARIALVNMIPRTPTKGHIPHIETNKDSLIFCVARSLSECGHDVTLYMSDYYYPSRGSADSDDEPFKACYLKTLHFSPPIAPITPSLFSCLMKNRFDCVIASEVTQPATILAFLARVVSGKKRLVVWQEMAYHQNVFFTLLSRMYHNIFVKYVLSRGFDLVIPRAISAKNFISRYLPRSMTIAYPVLHGVDGRVFFPQEEPQFTKWKFIYPARLIEDKNIQLAIRVIHEVRKLGYPATLDIIGDGPLRSAILQEISDQQLTPFVKLICHRLNASEMREHYWSATATFITTNRDLFLVSAMEAVACGCPLIISSGAAGAEDIKELNVGVSVPANDLEGFISAMLKIGNDDQYRADMRSRQLRERDKFVNCGKQISELIRDL